MNIFSVKDFSATTWLRILKFGTKIDRDELYCVTKTAAYCLSVPLLVHLTFSPMKISVADFSAPIRASVLKLCTKIDSDELYCVAEKQSNIAYQSLYLLIFLSFQWIFLSQISQLLLEPVFSNCVYCVDEKAHFSFFFKFSSCHSFITHMYIFVSFLSNYWL